MKVCFYTLGCKLNFSESSTLAREFVENGHTRTESFEDADVCIINSCSVTEHADKKCRNIIRRIHKLNPEAIIAVTGCYAQLKPQEVAAIEGVDIVAGNNNKDKSNSEHIMITNFMSYTLHKIISIIICNYCSCYSI